VAVAVTVGVEVWVLVKVTVKVLEGVPVIVGVPVMVGVPANVVVGVGVKVLVIVKLAVGERLGFATVVGTTAIWRVQPKNKPVKETPVKVRPIARFRQTFINNPLGEFNLSMYMGKLGAKANVLNYHKYAVFQ
jgi:hypothetical protein